ncbi:MAG: hypothetical protein WCK03_03170 [Candidatus Taylorbacteria bacterium]
MHGRKIRWQDGDQKLSNSFFDLPKGLMRSYFLKRNVAKDVTVNFSNIKLDLDNQARIMNRIDKIILGPGHSEIMSPDFMMLRQDFFRAVNNFYYGVAYEKMFSILKLLEHKILTCKPHCLEIKFLRELRHLYFG